MDFDVLDPTALKVPEHLAEPLFAYVRVGKVIQTHRDRTEHETQGLQMLIS